MNGTEFSSFSNFQILTKIGYPDLSRNLNNRFILMKIEMVALIELQSFDKKIHQN